ncbi:hypothetical protein ACT17_06215 [Mycolicibacterium conceptionense]|uniref:Uncharacterized protein n=1 Tax=Mycolicibacterium conceptionense TaxID=451644 RepID=A0A0J8UDM5_9MYCO|nr:hypothetical protein [Mycolicibacterium conceptionense]KMV19633.1 hypothetical protein ACT17_06215 [Mycolicibacterium conceptionense]
MNASTTTAPAEARRRAEQLLARYVKLTESNPGFHYDGHMHVFDHEAPESVTDALVAGPERLDDLARMLVDDAAFHTWRLRLEHPHWWIGGRVRGTTPLLARIVSELRGRDEGWGPHGVMTGAVGSHWFTQTLSAIEPLSAPARSELATALVPELVGRNVCLYGWLFLDFASEESLELVEMFPETGSRDTTYVREFLNALDRTEKVHGPDWAESFRVLVSDLDPIVVPGLTRALETELREHGEEAR